MRLRNGNNHHDPGATPGPCVLDNRIANRNAQLVAVRRLCLTSRRSSLSRRNMSMNMCSLLPFSLLASLQIQFQLLVLPLTSPEQPEALNPGLSFSRTLRVTIQKQRIDGWDAGAQEPMKLSHYFHSKHHFFASLTYRLYLLPTLTLTYWNNEVLWTRHLCLWRTQTSKSNTYVTGKSSLGSKTQNQGCPCWKKPGISPQLTENPLLLRAD